jgi:DnaJ-class molecular chaperone
MEPLPDSFEALIECYFQMWAMLATSLLSGPGRFSRRDGMKMQRAIPRHLQAEYRLLHLQAEASPAEVRMQYRYLAKRYHPDAGGNHADFLVLQQAYERVMEYLKTRS